MLELVAYINTSGRASRRERNARRDTRGIGAFLVMSVRIPYEIRTVPYAPRV